MKQTDLAGPEKFWYYLVNVFTLASLYFLKLAAKKAMCELNAEQAARENGVSHMMRQLQSQPRNPDAKTSGENQQ